MKRRNVFDETRDHLAKDAGAPEMKCRFCGDPTPWAVLSELGARCRSCYDAYCREGIQPRRQAQAALPRTPGRVNVMADRAEPVSAGPEHAAEALPFD